MATGKKVAHKLDELTGKGKEALGKASNDPDLQAEGEAQQATSNLKQAGEKVKDAFK